jgi:hypothetical protein
MWDGCEHLDALRANGDLYPLLASLYQVVKCMQRIPKQLQHGDSTGTATTVCLSCLSLAQASGEYASPVDAFVAVAGATAAARLCQGHVQGTCTTDSQHVLAVELSSGGFRPVCLRCNALL